MKRLIRVLILLLAGFATAAQAQVYIGASAMSTSAEFSDAVETFDTDDVSFKAFIGFNFWKFAGFEAAYRDLGTHEETTATGGVSADLSAMDLSFRGIIPLGQKVRLYGKVGYAYLSQDGSFSGAVSDFDESEWELMYGAGIDWTITEHFGVRAEWEEYDVDTSLNSLSAGFYWQF